MDWKQWFSGDRPPALSAEAWLPHLRSYDGHEREAAVGHGRTLPDRGPGMERASGRFPFS